MPAGELIFNTITQKDPRGSWAAQLFRGPCGSARLNISLQFAQSIFLVVRSRERHPDSWALKLGRFTLRAIQGLRKSDARSRHVEVLLPVARGDTSTYF